MFRYQKALMPKKRRSSIKAGKKKPVAKKQEKITKQDSLSSITSGTHSLILSWLLSCIVI